MPANPPVPNPLPLTAPMAIELLISPKFPPTNPPVKLVPPVTFPAARRSRDRSVVEADKSADAVVSAGAHVAARHATADHARGIVQPDKAAELAGLEHCGRRRARDIAARDIEAADRSEIESDESAGAAAGRVRIGHVAGRAGAGNRGAEFIAPGQTADE